MENNTKNEQLPINHIRRLLSSKKCLSISIVTIIFSAIIPLLIMLIIYLSLKYHTTPVGTSKSTVLNDNSNPQPVLSISRTKENSDILTMNYDGIAFLSLDRPNQNKHYIPLILMTFNVHFYRASKTTERIATFIVDHQPDVICLQENINAQNWASTELSQLYFNSNYTLVAECQAERIGPFQLSNTIYIHRKHMTHVQTLPSVNLQLTTEIPRCAAVIRLYDTTIANVHLCGGRFDDIKCRRFQTHKSLQLKLLIDTHHPDIMMGVFNNENCDEMITEHLNRYLFYQLLNETDQNLFIKYYTNGAHYLRDRTNYTPAYHESMVGATSIHGGTPDWVYVKNQTRLTGNVASYNTIAMNLSDHNAVTVEYLFPNRNGK